MPAPRFLVSAFRREQWPIGDVPEVAFAGRSNVGKSTALNRLAGQHALARVSKTPGRTQSLNFFELSRRGSTLRFADLPGYGFAKVPQAVKATWERMIGEYLSRRDTLKLVVVLVDARHDPTELDYAMVRWLEETGRTGLLVMTKSDRIPKNRRVAQQARMCKLLGVPAEASLLFSGTDGDGTDTLWERIEEACLLRAVREPAP